MKPWYNVQRWWVAPLFKIATSLGEAPAAAEMTAGLTDIGAQCLRAHAAAILTMVEEQRMTTLLTMWGRLVGERMVASSVRIDAHACTNAEGLWTGVDAVIAVVMVAATGTVQTALATTSVVRVPWGTAPPTTRR